jgi:hypothetical protein
MNMDFKVVACETIINFFSLFIWSENSQILFLLVYFILFLNENIKFSFFSFFF